jgi:hypothetical protein
MAIIFLGGFLVIAGLLVLARQALGRGRPLLKAPSPAPRAGMLEAGLSGLRSLGGAGNWPGIAMMVVGAALLLVGPGA